MLRTSNNTNRNFRNTTHIRPKERGATLIFALIIVLLISFIGNSSIKTSHLQEKIVGNFNDLQVAFNAAESTLREIEADLALGPASIPIGTESGYVESMRQNKPNWLDHDSWAASATADFEPDQIASRPQYFVEEVSYLDPGAFRGAADMASILSSEPQIVYRVTARATGGSDSTVVVVQSTFK